MACRFELEYNGESYPRTCPECGIAGKCTKGFKQVKYANGGYALLNEAGIAPRHVSDKWKETGIPSEVLKEQGRIAEDRATKVDEPIPAGVYYSVEHNNFYSSETQRGMGNDFWREWCSRKAQFPQMVSVNDPRHEAFVPFNAGKIDDRPYPGDPDKVRIGETGAPHNYAVVQAADIEKPTPAEIGDKVWGRDNVGKPKLTRVQRAKLLDLLERYVTGRNDRELEEILNEMLNIIDED